MADADKFLRRANDAYVGGNKKTALKNYLKAAEGGSVEGMFGAGRGYLYGEGTEIDYDEAFKWLKKAADAGHVAAKNYLGLVYARKNDDASAFNCFMEAALEGELVAAVNVANAYRHGEGVAQNKRKAVEWFMKAVEMNDPMAMVQLGDMYYYGEGVRKNRRKALNLYTRGAALGNGGSMNMIGFMHENGKIFRKNVEKACEWYLSAANSGHPTGMYNIARHYLSGEGIAQNTKAGIDWMMQAAILGCTPAMYELSEIYYERGGIEKAFAWMLRAAHDGYAPAMNSVGMKYYKGDGAEENIDEALKWFNAAVDNGNVSALSNLAYHYGYNASPKDLEKAVALYRKAVALGDDEALNELGDLYFENKDYDNAVKSYADAANRGITEAMMSLYFMYAEGAGVEENLELAFDYVEHAAEAGNVEAMAELGEIYSYDADESRLARYWLKKSAQGGCGNGMMFFARFLERRGDLKNARYWYYQAVEAGVEGARERLAEISDPSKINFSGSIKIK